MKTGNGVKAATLLVCAAAAFAEASFASAAAQEEPAAISGSLQTSPRTGSFAIRLPESNHVEYNGAVNMDSAGGKSGPMMYPAPNLVGFLAAVATHGVLVEGTKEREKSQMQKEADKVLVPYQPVLSAFTRSELLGRALRNVPLLEHATLVGSDDKVAEDKILAMVPVYTMTQDEKSLVLENMVSLYKASDLSKPDYRVSVRIVSAPRSETEVRQYWLRDEGESLKAASALLLAQSLDIAISDAGGSLTTAPGAFKTFRYFEGGVEKMERAQLLKASCGRALVRNLRGNLLSIPVAEQQSAAGGAAQCN